MVVGVSINMLFRQPVINIPNEQPILFVWVNLGSLPDIRILTTACVLGSDTAFVWRIAISMCVLTLCWRNWRAKTAINMTENQGSLA